MRNERYRAAISELERLLFPFQESEEEQEAFTPEGRRRIGGWLDQFVLSAVERDQLLTVLADAAENGNYYGNRDQYWKRHARIIAKVLAAPIEKDQL